MKKEVKDIYNMLKDSGELLEMFPGLTGEWEKDKIVFTRMYNRNKYLI